MPFWSAKLEEDEEEDKEAEAVAAAEETTVDEAAPPLQESLPSSSSLDPLLVLVAPESVAVAVAEAAELEEPPLLVPDPD